MAPQKKKKKMEKNTQKNETKVCISHVFFLIVFFLFIFIGVNGKLVTDSISFVQLINFCSQFLMFFTRKILAQHNSIQLKAENFISNTYKKYKNIFFLFCFFFYYFFFILCFDNKINFFEFISFIF